MMRRRFFQGKGLGRIIYQWAFLLLLFLVSLLLLKAVWGLWQKNSLAQSNLTGSVERLTELTTRQHDLTTKIAKLKTARGVEEEIRNNFSVVKAGEKVIKIVPVTPTTTPVTTSTKPWWKFW